MPRKNETVCLINLGCAKNLVDSEVILGRLASSGYIPFPEPERADIILINTCGFLEEAREESRKFIRRMLEWKKIYPSKKIGVIGCYVELARERLSLLFPQVDFWLGVKEIDRVVEVLRGEKFRPSSQAFLYDENMPRILSTPPVWAYIKIAEGCSHSCAFCTIPRIKGPYRSRSIASIVREARQLAELGVKEINLISQDTTYFGRDRGNEPKLARLLEELIKVPGIAWIRWLYGFPEEIDDSLLEVMTDPKICPYFDLPFQHAHRRILRLMRRGFDGRQAIKLINRIRQKIPEASIRTSLIVGFPGEGQGEFRALLDFVRQAEFDYLGVFTYSREEGTAAYELGDPVSPAEKKERKEAIMQLQAEISRKRLSRFLGRKLQVLLDGSSSPGKKIYYGRTRYQAPEVDGVVRIVWRNKDKPPRSGLAWIEITGYGRYDLQGRLIDEITD